MKKALTLLAITLLPSLHGTVPTLVELALPVVAKNIQGSLEKDELGQVNDVLLQLPAELSYKLVRIWGTPFLNSFIAHKKINGEKLLTTLTKIEAPYSNEYLAWWLFLNTLHGFQAMDTGEMNKKLINYLEGYQFFPEDEDHKKAFLKSYHDLLRLDNTKEEQAALDIPAYKLNPKYRAVHAKTASMLSLIRDFFLSNDMEYECHFNEPDEPRIKKIDQILIWEEKKD